MPSPLWRPWRYAAGIAFGAAVAVKWSGSLGMLAAIVMPLVWETTRRAHAAPRGRAFWRALGQEGFALVVAFVLLPAIVYVVAYLPWLHHFHWQVGELIDQQIRIAKYHLFELRTLAEDPQTGSLTPTHYAYSTVELARDDETRPDHVAGHRSVDPATHRDRQPDRVLGERLGLPYLAFAWWKKRDWVPGFFLMAVAFQYLPWLLVARPQFFFYVAPFTPFLVLGLVYLIRDLSDARLVVREPDGSWRRTPRREARRLRPASLPMSRGRS